MNSAKIQIIEERPILQIGEQVHLVVESTGVKLQTGTGGVLRLERPNVEVLSIGSQGLKGIKGDTGETGQTGQTGETGPAGDGDRNYVHVQNSPLATWTVTHNLNKFPAVTVVDSGATTVIGQVTFISTNTLIIDFSSAFSGKAYIN